jgi:uncharacterized membrane protein YheB (UPF0754 family)
MILRNFINNKKLINTLFKKCGKNELNFIVMFGLYGGFGLGVLQLILLLLIPSKILLIITSIIIGYITDYIALKLMFEPINPITIMGYSIQGLFLKRQEEVSKDFSAFMSLEFFQPKQLWDELILGTLSSLSSSSSSSFSLSSIPLSLSS